MRIVIDGGHGPDTVGKRTPDGTMREFHFNSVVAYHVKQELSEYDVQIMFTHEVNRDVPLKERTDKANAWKAHLFVSIHANGYGSGGWNNVQGIETFVHTDKPKEAYALATEIQNQLIRSTGRPNRGVKTANFHVLREAKMTSVLIECGFMTNKEEAELLKTDSYRLKCANAIVTALVNYYKLKKKEGDRVDNDKDVSNWAKEAWEKAERKGVLDGTRPRDPVTRQELAVILDRVGLLDSLPDKR